MHDIDSMKPKLRALGKRKLAAAVSSVIAPTICLLPPMIQAQEDEDLGVTEVIIVTATRRANTVQDVPINITAITTNTLREQRLVGLDEISRIVPGLTMLDRGARDEFPDVLVRGLNTSDTGPRFTGGTVATYLGEIPLFVDFRTNDLERVEVLIGPQGTLYGSGTLGGAVRYLPIKPGPDAFEAQVRGNFFALEESSGVGADAGFTVNFPLVDDRLAFRASVDYLDDPGYIDYPYVVREAGVSDPQPDFSDPDAVAANLRRVEDANFEETLSGRVALRWLPSDAVDLTLSYNYQNVETGGRSIANVEAFGTGRYEAAYRYEEPAEYRNELLSLELIADLGFAELTSATGLTQFDFLGQRDQTDLLLNFEYYYETFPSFSAFTREIDDEETFTQELRLVSTGGGQWSWIAGLFYNKFDGFQTSEEFTPHFDQWAVDNLGGIALRPDALEYFEIADEELTEKALYGELSYDFGDAWQVTVGMRAYEFDDRLIADSALPLFDTVYFGDPADSINLDLGDIRTDDSGTLFKVNLSHNFTNDVLGYLTVSEGYRIGGINSWPECTPEDLNNPGQAVCALPDEILIKADTTTNYELGLHSTLANGRVVINGAIFHIDWEDVQVADTTLNGGLPITSNGGAADSDGLELQAQWQIGDHWRMSGTYAYTKAELASGTDAILGDSLTDALFTPAGSRLPGSPEDQGSLGLTYSTAFRGGLGLDINYGIAYMGNILNSIGAEQIPSALPYRGEKIPSYTLHHITATLSGETWTAAFYVDNLFDDYYYTSTRASQRLVEQYRNYLDVPSNTEGFLLRGYGRYIGRPRTMGISVTFDF